MSDNYNHNESFITRYGKDFLAGTLAGMAQTVSGQPFDTIKVRLQISTKFKGPIDCFLQSIKSEGIRGLYKGMATPLVFAGVFTAIELSTWGTFKKLIYNSKPREEGESLSMPETMLAGAMAGFITPLVYTPTELIKINLQAQDGNAKKYNGPIDAFRKIVQQHGIRGLYNGNLSCMMREIPSNAIYFGTYESAKRYLFPKNPDGSTPLAYTMVAGSIAGFMNWIFAFPQDVVKSRLAMNDPQVNTLGKAIAKIYSKQGFGGFFRGLSPALIRAIPANGCTFLVFEMVLRIID
eukprot:TRINITY_DN16956_c0_g1_i2.p1 TRINITY_DN16956_c0_g1~~TRINITY_DN16956_c0_g1_i2.p1  ORF type:complete len:293 (-),score=45.65 TRINITY_DN16956_c0_g1_i2:8-886(-)